MKCFARLLLFVCVGLAVPALAAGPEKVFSFFVGTWVGKTKYASNQSPLDVPIDSAVKGTLAVGNKYLQLETTVFIPGRPEETMMLLTFDPQMGLFRAWTFNDHTAGDRILTGVPSADISTTTLASTGENVGGSITAYQEIMHIDARDQFTLTYQIRHHDAKLHKDVWLTAYTSVYKRQTG